MRHCVDKTTHRFNMISYRLDSLLLDKMTKTFNIMTYNFDIIKHRLDMSATFVDKIICLCKIITLHVMPN